MDVTIYIDVYFTGNLKKGTGEYTIVLEYKKMTKEHIGGIKITTKNRTELTACIAAFGYMKKTCNIRIVTNAQFVANAFNQNWDKTKNKDLWQQLLDLTAQHNVTFEYQLTNSYSTYMYQTMHKAEISYQIDNLI